MLICEKKHDARVTELLAANNREVERRRAAEREVAALKLAEEERDRLAVQLDEVTRERDELQASFDLRWQADMTPAQFDALLRNEPEVSTGFIHKIRAHVDALTLQVKEGRDALFPATRKEVRDGITVNVSSDAEWNLRAALEDLTNSNGNDAVTRRTISAVADQLAAARATLTRNEQAKGAPE